MSSPMGGQVPGAWSGFRHQPVTDLSQVSSLSGSGLGHLYKGEVGVVGADNLQGSSQLCSSAMPGVSSGISVRFKHCPGA